MKHDVATETRLPLWAHARSRCASVAIFIASFWVRSTTRFQPPPDHLLRHVLRVARTGSRTNLLTGRGDSSSDLTPFYSSTWNCCFRIIAVLLLLPLSLQFICTPSLPYHGGTYARQSWCSNKSFAGGVFFHSRHGEGVGCTTSESA